MVARTFANLRQLVAALAGATALLSIAGCANFQMPSCSHLRLPRIDPSGERLFLPCDSPPALPPPPPVLAIEPAPGPVVAPTSPPPVIPAAPVGDNVLCGVSVSPSQVIAPVGSEVVMIASLRGDDGHLVPHERIEWNLAPDSAGQFLSVGQRRPHEFVGWLHGLPKKVDSRLALNTTLVSPLLLDRGTPTPADDVCIQPGQSWVTVTSPTEGTSHVTVFAPQIGPWDRRQQTASIYWVDAQWRFPPPSIVAVGSRPAVTTSVVRQSNGTPVAGWQVRYEIVSGPDAGFAPDGATTVEVLTDVMGEARAELFQKQGMAGTNQISIQVIRPAGVGGQSRALPLGTGSTLQTWTSADLAIAVTGPSQAGAGATVAYRLEVNNPAESAASNVIVGDQAPAGFEFVDSNPAAIATGGGHEWRLGDVPPRGRSTVEVRYRLSEPGTHSYCATLSSDAGTTTRSCVTTQVLGNAPPPAAPATSTPPSEPATPGSLEVTVTGPVTAERDSDVQFEIEVVNRGQTLATGILVNDRFDAGLQHVRPGNTIERDMVDLAPGAKASLTVAFRVVGQGELCQDITVTANGGARGTARHCLTTADPPTGNAPADNSPAESSNADGSLSVSVTGPNGKMVGESALFKIVVTNNSAETLTDLQIANQFETLLEPNKATVGYTKVRTGVLAWQVPSLAAGKSIRREVEFKCLRDAPRACNRVTVTAAGGATATEEACLEITAAEAPTPPPAATTPNPLSVSVADTSDPVKVGQETLYQVLVKNESQQSIYDVTVSVTFDDKLRFEGSSGPEQGTISPSGVRFKPIREFRAGENALNFELRMKGAKPGTGKFHVEVTSRGQARPATADQTTEVLSAE